MSLNYEFQFVCGFTFFRALVTSLEFTKLAAPKNVTKKMKEKSEIAFDDATDNGRV